jgi:hypothetical protein
MSASSQAANHEKQTLGITFGMLASNGKGLKIYADQVGSLDNTRKVAIQHDGKNCTCTSFVLGMLAIIVAAGAATLIAFSGGPSNATLFYTGIALGVAFVGLTTWLLVVISRSIQHRKAQNELVANLTGKVVPEKNVLAEMEKPEATAEQVHSALRCFPTQQRQAFFEYIYSTYFSVEASRGPLTEEQKKILTEVAKFPADVAKLNFENLNRDFALHMLASIKPDVIDKSSSGGGLELVTKLFEKVGPPKTVRVEKKQQLLSEEVKIFARHPRTIAMGVQTKSDLFTPNLARAIFGQMETGQKTLFLKTLSEDFAKLTDDKLAEMGKIEQVARYCAFDVFSKEFVAQFSGPIDPDNQEAVASYAQAEALLEQLAKWPRFMAERFYLQRAAALSGNPTLINALYRKMDQDQQNEFINYAATNLAADFDCAYWINAYAKGKDSKGIDLPDPTKRIFAKMPAAMGKAMATLDDAQSAGRATQSAAGIILLMSIETRVAFLEAEKSANQEAFAKRMTEEILRPAQNKLSDLTENHIAVAYFKRNPKEFRELVLLNKQLGDEKARALIALKLLEKMNGNAETVIRVMDDGSKGFPYFNYLVNILVDRMKVLDLNKNPPGDAEAKLVARFNFAPIMAETRKKVIFFGGLEWKLKDYGPDWHNFEQIAAGQQNNVWKKA